MSDEMLKNQLTEQMKTLMRAREKEKLMVIRLILAAIKQIEVDERKTLSDDAILTLLNKMIKQRQDAIVQFEKGNRPDLIQQEKFEIEIIQQFLPEPLTDSEVDALIQEAINTIKPVGMKDMGKVIAHIRSKAEGRADMGIVSQRVKAALTNPS